jgi:glycogenin glucosyltransferase
MRRAYVSILTTDNYLPGILGLAYSIRATRTKYDLEVLVTPDVSAETRAVLSLHGILWTKVSELKNPTDVSTNHRWYRTYSKLNVFGLTHYEKLLFVDADILVLENIDALFECEHMSGVSSGSMLPECANWTGVNSGLLVVTPNASVFSDMVARIGHLEKLSSGGTADTPRAGSDQDFINAYYPDWSQRTRLHLDHKYNMLHYHLDRYNQMFGYGLEPTARSVSVVHFASYLKPWTLPIEIIERLTLEADLSLEERALRLWGKKYGLIRSCTGFDIPAVRCSE